MIKREEIFIWSLYVLFADQNEFLFKGKKLNNLTFQPSFYTFSRSFSCGWAISFSHIFDNLLVKISGVFALKLSSPF